MRSTEQIGRRSGSTLVEALLAVVILAVSIAGGTKMVVMTMRLSDAAKNKNTTINIAKNMIERISVWDFSDFGAWDGSNMVSNAQGHLDPEGYFKINTEINYIQTNLAEVVVQVRAKNRMTLEFDKDPEILITRIADI